MNADWKVEKAQYAELNVPTCGKIAVCQLCRERQPFWNSHDGLDQCHGVRSHEFTPHAPCCQESDSRSTWDALALRATSRCLFTHPIPERRHWRHFWTSKETPSWALALEQAFAPWTAVWPLPPRQGATFCLDHLFFWGSLVSWSAQADHCGMITCERFVPTPHAPCCQESSTVGVHGTLALGATSRCLFTIDITKVIYAGLPVDISVFLWFAQATAKIRPRPAHGLFWNKRTW